MSYLVARPQWNKIKEYLRTGLPRDHWSLLDETPKINGPVFLDYDGGKNELDEELDDDDVRMHARFAVAMVSDIDPESFQQSISYRGLFADEYKTHTNVVVDYMYSKYEEDEGPVPQEKKRNWMKGGVRLLYLGMKIMTINLRYQEHS